MIQSNVLTNKKKKQKYVFLLEPPTADSLLFVLSQQLAVCHLNGQAVCPFELEQLLYDVRLIADGQKPLNTNEQLIRRISGIAVERPIASSRLAGDN